MGTGHQEDGAGVGILNLSVPALLQRGWRIQVGGRAHVHRDRSSMSGAAWLGALGGREAGEAVLLKGTWSPPRGALRTSAGWPHFRGVLGTRRLWSGNRYFWAALDFGN